LSGVPLLNQREFHAAPQGINPFGANLHAITQAPRALF
jgi:hypothetical protein